MLLSKTEKEKQVLLEASKGRTYREIARDLHVNPKFISDTIKEYTQDNKQNVVNASKLSKESLAFKMFKEGKSNVDVAIMLNMRAAEVIILYQDFLDLSNLNKINQLYRELNQDLRFFIELYERMKEEGLTTTKDMLNIARTQARIRDLDKTIYCLYDEISRLNLIKMDLRDEIKELTRFRNAI